MLVSDSFWFIYFLLADSALMTCSPPQTHPFFFAFGSILGGSNVDNCIQGYDEHGWV